MRVFCIQCKRETNHKVLYEFKRTYDNEVVWAFGTWQIIECLGCEDVSFREVWENSEDIDPIEGCLIENVKLYPRRSKETLPIKTYYNVPIKIKNIYNETIDAFNNEMLILCSGGLRATIEGICNNEIILDGQDEFPPKGISTIQTKMNLPEKISKLSENGLLTKNHAAILHEHRFLGNEALHTLDQPSKAELKIAIEIIELTLDNIYELTEKASDLKYEKQKRKKRNK
jgi:hypothetical protein